jgi:hypothetical protein
LTFLSFFLSSFLLSLLLLLLLLLFLLLPLGAQVIRETLVSLQFLNLKTFGRTAWTGHPLVARPLRKTNTE